MEPAGTRIQLGPPLSHRKMTAHAPQVPHLIKMLRIFRDRGRSENSVVPTAWDPLWTWARGSRWSGKMAVTADHGRGRGSKAERKMVRLETRVNGAPWLIQERKVTAHLSTTSKKQLPQCSRVGGQLPIRARPDPPVSKAPLAWGCPGRKSSTEPAVVWTKLSFALPLSRDPASADRHVSGPSTPVLVSAPRRRPGSTGDWTEKTIMALLEICITSHMAGF